MVVVKLPFRTIKCLDIFLQWKAPMRPFPISWLFLSKNRNNLVDGRRKINVELL
jgi:hypothetical protein